MADAMLTPESPEIISRDEARAIGLKFFFTGQPCDNKGHIAQRYVSTAHCLECKLLPKTRVYIDKGCSIDGCDKPHQARGWCLMHYKLFCRNGDPLARKHAAKWSTMKWLEDHKDYEGDECLIWPFAMMSKRGYGKTQFRGKHCSAHLAMCILAHGEKPAPKMVAAHSCGKGHLACVNPKHLRGATYAENCADMLIHGTRPIGHKCYQAKLTPEDVLKIRAIGNSMTHAEIATLYGISAPSVGKVLRGRSYRNVDSPE